MKKLITDKLVRRKVLFIEDLVDLIGKTATTIRTCSTNSKYKHLIPTPWKMPNSRRLCWFEDEVLDWIESGRPAFPPPTKRARGRPTKAEQLNRQRWQISASEKKEVCQ
jgi:hypothetical protein